MTNYSLDHFIVNGQIFSGSNTLMLIMDSLKDVEAVYYKAATTVTLVIGHSGGGRTYPDIGAYTYDQEASVSLTATAVGRHIFKNWNVNGKIYYARTIVVVLMANTRAYATFSR